MLLAFAHRRGGGRLNHAPASEVRTFQDWTVACDNGLGCEAIAPLPPDVEWSEWLNLSFRRGAAAGDRPVVMLQGFEGTPAALLADGRPLAARFAGGDEGFIVQADPGELVGALRNARALEVRGADGARLGLVSLAGASAAMLYMDERQRRIGTVTALVRTGPQPASAQCRRRPPCRRCGSRRRRPTGPWRSTPRRWRGCGASSAARNMTCAGPRNSRPSRSKRARP